MSGGQPGRSKRPSFQFYPGDWRNEPGLRLCTIAARGLWMDMLCLMHEGEPYGFLTIQKTPLTPIALARLCGESPSSVVEWLEELRVNGVYSTTDEGVIFSRRMVRDETVREARAAGGHLGAEHGQKGAEFGKKGGRPRKGPSGTKVRGVSNLPPSSSTSSSSPSSSPSEEEEVLASSAAFEGRSARASVRAGRGA